MIKKMCKTCKGFGFTISDAVDQTRRNYRVNVWVDACNSCQLGQKMTSSEVWKVGKKLEEAIVIKIQNVFKVKKEVKK